MKARRILIFLVGLNTLVGVTGSVLAALWLHDLRWLVVGMLLGIAFAAVTGGTS